MEGVSEESWRGFWRGLGRVLEGSWRVSWRGLEGTPEGTWRVPGGTWVVTRRSTWGAPASTWGEHLQRGVCLFIFCLLVLELVFHFLFTI